MGVAEIFSVLMSAVFGRKRKKVTEVVEAMEEYEKSPGSVSHRLRLEAAFFEAYKKKASAAVIMKMASSYLGPYEAFDAYSRSSLLIGCDYAEESLAVHPRARKKLLHEVICCLVGVVICSLSIFFVLIGGYLVVELMKMFLKFGLEDFFQLDFDGVVEMFFVLVVCLFFLLFGGLFLWLSFKMLAVDRTKSAVSMADSIQPSSSSTD